MANLIEFMVAEASLQAEFLRRKIEVPEAINADDLGELAEGFLSEFFSDKPGNEFTNTKSNYLKQVIGRLAMASQLVHIERVENLTINEPVSGPEEEEKIEEESGAKALGIGEKADPDNEPLTEAEGSDIVETEMALSLKALSFEQLLRKLDNAVMAQMGYEYWLHATFDSFLIARNAQTGDLFKVPYTIEGTDVKLGDQEPVEAEYIPVGESKKSFRVIRNVRTGEIRWVSVSSNTAWDSYEEKFSKEALQGAVAFMQKAKDHGELRLEHHPSSRVGYCDYSAVVGEFLVESGPFDTTVRAQKTVETLENDEEQKFKVSIGFLFNDKKLVKGVHTDSIVIFERSITGSPANPLTAISVSELGGGMDTEQVKAKLAAIVGDEQAAKIVADGNESISGLMEALGVKNAPEGVEEVGFRETENPPTMAEPPPKIQVAMPDGTTLVAELDPEEVDVDNLAEIIKEAVTAAMQPVEERLVALEGLKANAEEAPRAIRYRITQSGGKAEKATDTEVKEAEEAVEVAAGSKGPFWGDFPGGR